jgi:enoyl-CoA hydratase/carnithine racemase
VIELEHHDDVWLVQMHSGENRFNRQMVTELNKALDTVEAVNGPAALVTTGEGKFYSNGVDLDWLATRGENAAAFLDDVHRLLGRILGFPAITVAALNGHAFAAGAMFASAHDFIVMRQDRGYWCLPEVDLGLSLTPAMHAMVATNLPRVTLHEAFVTGRRYSAPEAVKAGIAHEAAAEGDVVARAIQLASELASKDRRVVAEHKRLTHENALRLCDGSPSEGRP